jgi:hypothetical protein
MSRAWIVVALIAGCAGSEEVSESPAALAECASISAGDGWSNQVFDAQSGRFRVELEATPSADGIDGLVGLSTGGASTFSHLAVAVRFSPQGMIDVRDGATYRADIPFSYVAGARYELRIDVDVAAHAYTVWVRPPDSYDFFAVATRYAFRTEQQAVTQLGAFSALIDSAAGSLQLCDFRVLPAIGPGCQTTGAGDGFQSQAIFGGSVLVATEFVVTPSASNIDAVIGQSAGAATSFSDLATAVRFAPNGMIDVRDGDTYHADGPMPYVAGAPYRIRFVADATRHRYTVYIIGPNAEYSQSLAWNYAFRTEQQSAGGLGQLVTIVDSSAGSIDVCSVMSRASHGVSYSVLGGAEAVPIDGDEAFVADGQAWFRTSATGQHIGPGFSALSVAVDDAQNTYTAWAGANALTITSRDAAMNQRWVQTYSIGSNAGVQSMGLTMFGDLVVLVDTVGNPRGAVESAWFLRPEDGTLRMITPAPAYRGTVDRTGFTLANGGQTAVTVSHYNRDGGIDWTNTYPGRAEIQAITADPSGAIAFGGLNRVEMSFGGPPIPLSNTLHQSNGFVVKLSETGAHVFSKKTGWSQVDALGANSTSIVATGSTYIDHHFMHLSVFDDAGTVVRQASDVGLGEEGLTTAVAIGPTNRIYWGIAPIWGGFAYRQLVVLAP